MLEWLFWDICHFSYLSYLYNCVSIIWNFFDEKNVPYFFFKRQFLKVFLLVYFLTIWWANPPNLSACGRLDQVGIFVTHLKMSRVELTCLSVNSWESGWPVLIGLLLVREAWSILLSTIESLIKVITYWFSLSFLL